MPTPIITLPIHTIEQARALAGLLRAFIDGQSPDTNDGQDWNPDPDLAGIAALYAHLDAGIAEATKPVPARHRHQCQWCGNGITSPGYCGKCREERELNAAR